MILDSYERYWEPLRDGGGGDGGGGGGGDEGAPEGAGPEGAPEGFGGTPSGEAPGVGPDAGPGGIGAGFDATGGITGAAATGDFGQSGQGFGPGGYGDVTGTGAPTSSGASVTSEAGIGAGTAASGQTGAAATGGAGGFGGFGEGGFGGAGGFAGAEPEGVGPGPGPGTQTSTSGIDPGALVSPEGWTDWGTAAAQSPGMLDPAELAALEAQYGGQQSVIGHAPTNEALQTGMDAIGTGTSFGVIDAMMGGAPPGGGGGGLGQAGVSGDGFTPLNVSHPLGLGPLASGFGTIAPPPGPEAGITLEDGTVVPPEVTNLLAGAGITEPSAISQILQEAMAQGGDVGANLRARLEALIGGGGGGGFGLLGDWQQDGTPVQAGGGGDIDAGGIINGPQDLPPQLGAFQEWMRGKTLAQIVGALDSGRVA